MKKVLLFLLLVVASVSCSDDVSSTYSTAHPVRCNFTVVQYTELFQVIDNFGQFASIRKSSAKLIMKHGSSETTYNMLETQKYFDFGLGGLIVGTTFEGNYRAYDLSCPNCDRATYRLNITDDGFAKCPNNTCHIVYNLNYDGIISEVPKECNHQNPRALYRYKVAYDGMTLNIYN